MGPHGPGSNPASASSLLCHLGQSTSPLTYKMQITAVPPSQGYGED